jgi:hypothetical protein
MKVINLFPNGPTTATPAKTDLHVGPVHFTCPHCRVSSSARFDNMVFRVIHFICGSCNAPFRLVNPGFIPPETKPSGKNQSPRKTK